MRPHLKTLRFVLATCLFASLAMTGVPTAHAACPSSNSSYPFAIVDFHPNGGTYELRWAGQNVTDGPCSKIRFNDQTSAASNCLEVSYDWDVGNPHYDSRNFITCHQSFFKNNTLSEALRGEPTTPYTTIQGMRAVRVCLRVGQAFGPRSGCILKLGGGFNPPLNPNNGADFWRWNSSGALMTWNQDPP